MIARSLRTLLLAAMLACAAAGPASAANFTVTTTADADDTTPGDGICGTPLAGAPCSLRAAVREANAKGDADAISVPAGTYVLDQTEVPDDTAEFGDLDITGPTTITGTAGARATVVNANGIDRVFEIIAGASGVQITGLTITGGGPRIDDPAPLGGTGLANAGGLTLVDSAVVDNVATSTANDGAGIYNSGTGVLTLDRVLIARNIAGSEGGGIYNDSGNVSLNSSTISGNEARTDGGGYFGAATIPALSVDYSTITGNTAPGVSAIAWGGGGSPHQISNSIVALNTGQVQCNGPSSSLGHNIESGGDCNFTNGANGDKQATNPQIGALANNGGQTDTHLPAATSPAVDAGPATGCPALDQRGAAFTRPSGFACDIGAVELQQPAPPAPRPSVMTLDPDTANRTPGDDNVVTATVRNDNGSPAANRTIRYEINGANASDGTATTDASGIARISWAGVHEGSDVLTGYVDTNGDLTPGFDEPTGKAQVNWALPTPKQGRSFNLDPISGKVRIRLPRGVSAKSVQAAGGASAALDRARQVPIGTTVDTRRGRVEMTMADSQGNLQRGQFYAGQYTTKQPRKGRRPVTELKLTESLICPKRRSGKVIASRARSRRLWGNARGRFRTRGRHSSASVRGTVWLVKDTCTKTTTVVRSGKVTVRDFAKRKNVTVKRGKRYVARARRR